MWDTSLRFTLFEFLWHQLKKITSAIKDGRKVTVTIKNYRRDGSAFWNRIKVCPMKDEDGKVSLIVGLQKEVPTHKFDTLQLNTYNSVSTSHFYSSHLSDASLCITGIPIDKPKR